HRPVLALKALGQLIIPFCLLSAALLLGAIPTGNLHLSTLRRKRVHSASCPLLSSRTSGECDRRNPNRRGARPQSETQSIAHTLCWAFRLAPRRSLQSRGSRQGAGRCGMRSTPWWQQRGGEERALYRQSLERAARTLRTTVSLTWGIKTTMPLRNALPPLYCARPECTEHRRTCSTGMCNWGVPCGDSGRVLCSLQPALRLCKRRAGPRTRPGSALNIPRWCT